MVDMFYKKAILWKQGLHQRTDKFCKQVFWARLASFGQLGLLICDPHISSKLQNGINDLKWLENKIYTMMKGRGLFMVSSQSHSPAVVKCNMFIKVSNSSWNSF